MEKFKSTLSSFVSDENGATLVEYAVMAVAVVTLTLVTFKAAQNTLGNILKAQIGAIDD